jgi:superfamily I DNA and RNA helicase
VKEYAPLLQKELVKRNVASTIPGLIEDADTYAEPGRVTISSVFRAKGNEAYIVYILGFEELYNYVDAIENRNRAFTAISRSKAWIRITGTGPKMQRAKQEVERILNDIPRFTFTFPDMKRIRSLDAETNKRRRQRDKGNKAVGDLLKDPKLLNAMDPELKAQLRKLLLESDDRENQ